MQLLSSIADLKDIVNKEYIDSILADYVLSANLGALATKDSLAFSDLTSRPSKLSDFTDDVVAGKYLPLSGGTVTGTIEFTASTPALKFYRDYGNVPYIHFGASPTSGYGEVGADKNGNLVFWSLVSGNSAYNAWNTVLHAKNIGEYALKKVANVSSLDAINAGEFFYSGYRPTSIPEGNYTGGVTLQTFLDAENDYRTQLAFSSGAKGFVRSYINGVWYDWKTIAFTDSNVASATKLATARTLWGQSFDGTADVAAQLTFNANDAALSAWKKDGSSTSIFLQVNPDRHLLVGQGTARENGGLYLYGNDIRMCYGNAGSSSNTAMLINASGNVTIGSSDTAGADYKLRVDGESRFTDRVSVASLRIVPVNGSYAADFTIEGSSLTLNRELKFTNVTASDICSGIAAAFKTSLAQAESLIARNIILGASSGSASNLALNFQKYTSVSNTAPNGLTTLMTLTTDGNLGIGTASPEYKLDVVGKARISDELIVTYPTGFRWAYGDYGTLFRNDGQNFYILFTDSGGALTGSWNSLRPFRISLTTGDVAMEHNLTVDGQVKAGAEACANKRFVIFAPSEQAKGVSFGYMKATIANAYNIGIAHLGCNYGGSSDITNTSVDYTAISMYRSVVGIGKEYDYASIRAIYDAKADLGVTKGVMIGSATLLWDSASSSLKMSNLLTAKGGINVTATDSANNSGQSGVAGVFLRNEGGIEISHASTPYIDFHYAKSTSDYDVRLICQSTNDLRISGHFYPMFSLNYELGAQSLRWSAIWAGGMNLSGNADISGVATVGSLKIGNIVLSDENGTLKIAGNAYTTGQLGAGEAGQPTSGGGSVQYWSNEHDRENDMDIIVSAKEYIGTNTIVGWDSAGTCMNDLYIGFDSYTIWMQGSVDEASDMRLKTVIDAVNLDIRDIAYAPIFNYVFKSRPQGRQMLGSSAQYWQAIAPKAVSENDKGNLAMNYGAIALASVVAVAKKVVTHEEEIAELKSKVQSLETRLAKYELN